MNPPSQRPGHSLAGPLDVDKVLDHFEFVWRSGTAPRIEDFLPAAGRSPIRQQLLADMVKIDLEYRWKNRCWFPSAVGGPRLEDYAARHPELGRTGQLAAELIGEEYRVRRCWGDRPGHAEYAARFPGQEMLLQAILEQIDAELAASQVRRPRVLLPADGALPPVRSGVQPMAPPVLSNTTLLDTIRQHRLLSPAQLDELVLADLQRRSADARAIAAELLRRGWLTAYQVNQMMQGRAADLWVGPYLLLERLGQGGAGQVFKARHQHMDRVVAVKLIRRDLLDDPEVIGRFQREIKVISQLTHPNVVQAHDAGPLGANYFLAMEYVDGTDLARLVKQQGPLPAPQACDYVRQAALGLQHIHERGLIHRDIKPSNLLLAGLPMGGGCIKILDLGLARLTAPAAGEAVDNLTATGTMMMGTLDYMAPEQALNFRSVDIRADIYSLGCTLYYLLAGRPPFAEGTAAQKLLYHQQVEPAPLEHLRGDLPATLPALLRKMIAKRPADRFQTPREIADMLAALPTAVLAAEPRNLLPAVVVPRPGVLVPRAASPPQPVVVVLGGHPPADPGRLGPVRRVFGLLRTHRYSGPARRPKMLVAGAAVLLGGLLAGFLLIRAFREEKVYLSDMPEADATGFSSQHPFRKHGWYMASGQRVFISAGGTQAEKGLATFPIAGQVHIRYRLDKRYKTFTSGVALDDRVEKLIPQALRFTVLGDDKILWQSKPVQRRADLQDCTVPVRDVEVLELLVTFAGGPGDYGQYAVWLNPSVQR